MTNIKCITFIMCFVFSFACKQKVGVNENIIEVKIVPEESNLADILQIVENIDIIPLETTDDCLIGRLLGIKTAGNDIYIIDQKNPIEINPIKLFSKDGKFISTVGIRGAGPGEYISTLDFMIDNDTISVFDCNGRRKWIRYSKDNRLLYETDFDVPFSKIYPVGNGKFLAFSGSGYSSEYNLDHYLYCIDANCKILSRNDLKIPPYDIPISTGQNIFSQTAAGQLLYIKEFRDTIYTVSNNLDINPKYHLDFGKYWYSNAFLKNNYDNKDIFAVYRAVDENKYARWVNFWENDAHLLINYSIKNDNGYDNYLAIYSKTTGNTLNFKGSSGDLYVNLMTHPYCIQDNHFVALVQAYDFLELASKINSNDAVSEKIKQCAKRLDESDNPVMVRFTFKSNI